MTDTIDQPNSEIEKTTAVKATSSFFHAFTSLFNLVMISTVGFFIVMNIWEFIASGINIFLLILTILASAFLVIYIWAILNRELEIDNKGIEYKEARRHVALDWQDIEAIRIEKPLGQITLWVGNKKIRIHTFGLNRRELKDVYRALEKKVKERQISNL